MRLLAAALVTLLALPAAVHAGVDGFRLEGGPVFLTKSGSLLDPGTIDTDAGWALRGRLRFGLGGLSVAGEIQESSQGFGKTPKPGSPDNLNNTYLGVSLALHPISLLGVTPYGELGLGKLFFADEKIDSSGGNQAFEYGLGVLISGDRVGVDVELRWIRQSDLLLPGLSDDFKYSPRQFSIMVSFKP